MTSSLAASLPGHTPTQWAHDFLVGIGAPPSQANIDFVRRWENLESGGGGGLFNPLNSVLPSPGSTPLNSVGVQNYPTYNAGIAASITTFTQTQWAGVRNALIASDPTAAQDAVNAEYATWGGGPLNILGTGLPGNTAAPGGSSSSSGAGGYTEHCILSLPSASFKVFGIGPTLGGNCLLHSNQGRALLGAFCLVAGAGLMLVGLGFVAIGGNSPVAKVAPLIAAAA